MTKKRVNPLLEESKEAVEMQNKRKEGMDDLIDKIQAQAEKDPEGTKPKKMIRTTVYLSEAQSKKIKLKALESGESVSSMIQQYIEKL